MSYNEWNALRTAAMLHALSIANGTDRTEPFDALRSLIIAARDNGHDWAVIADATKYTMGRVIRIALWEW